MASHLLSLRRPTCRRTAQHFRVAQLKILPRFNVQECFTYHGCKVGLMWCPRGYHLSPTLVAIFAGFRHNDDDVKTSASARPRRGQRGESHNAVQSPTNVCLPATPRLHQKHVRLRRTVWPGRVQSNRPILGPIVHAVSVRSTP